MKRNNKLTGCEGTLSRKKRALVSRKHRKRNNKIYIHQQLHMVCVLFWLPAMPFGTAKKKLRIACEVKAVKVQVVSRFSRGKMRGIIFAKIKQFFQDLNFGSEWEEPKKKI